MLTRSKQRSLGAKRALAGLPFLLLALLATALTTPLHQFELADSSGRWATAWCTRVEQGRLAPHGRHDMLEDSEVHVFDVKRGGFVPASQAQHRGTGPYAGTGADGMASPLRHEVDASYARPAPRR